MSRWFSLLASPGFLLLLLAFFMPWYSVTCSNRPIATGSGWEIATSGFQRAPDRPTSRREAPGAGARGRAQRGEHEMRSLWLLLVPLAGLAGLAFAVLGGLSDTARAQRFRVVAAALGVTISALVAVHWLVVKGQLRDQLAASPAEGPLGGAQGRAMLRAIVNSIQMEILPGWYVALTSALLAAMMACIAVVLGRSAARAKP